MIGFFVAVFVVCAVMLIPAVCSEGFERLYARSGFIRRLLAFAGLNINGGAT